MTMGIKTRTGFRGVRALAAKAGVSASHVHRVMTRERKPSAGLRKKMEREGVAFDANGYAEEARK